MLFNFYIYSKYGQYNVGISNDVDEVIPDEYFELLSIFWERITDEHETLYYTGNLFQKMSDNIRERYSQFVDKYSDKSPYLNRFKSSLDKIPNDEYFFVSNKDSYTTEDIIFIQNLLDAHNASEDDQERAEILNNKMEVQNLIFEDIFLKYEILVFDSEQTVLIGESDRKKRKCRFCGNDANSEIKATFRKKAHAFSEALGNKSIVLNEECDECNGKFGATIEKDFITYLDVFRVFYKVIGKNGIPKLKYENGGIECVDGKIKIQSKDMQFDEETKKFKVLFKSSQKLKMVNIYKTLCKYVLSVIDKDQLQYTQETIKWISTDTESINLPKIAILLNNVMFSETPMLAVYIRKQDSNTLPHIIGDFKFKSLSFVFILPFSQKNAINFTDEKDFEVYWNSLKHYSTHSNWNFYNFSSIFANEFQFTLIFERSQEQELK